MIKRLFIAIFFIAQIFFGLFFLLVTSTKIKADSPSIIINELFPDPASPQTDSQDEFIELYNPNDFPVDISEWVLKDNFVGKPVHNFTISFGTTIEPYGFRVFYSHETPISLNNDGDIVELYNSSGELIDNSESYNKAKTGQSYSFDGGSWFWTETPTPETQNIIDDFPNKEEPGDSLPSFSSNEIIINELLPNPAAPQTDSKDEFIELRNPNGFTVDLGNWVVQDTIGSVKKYTFPAGTSIGAFGYLVLYSRDSRIALNNSGDLVSLFDPSGGLVNSTEDYGKAQAGWSFSFDGEYWSWSETPTPGADNIISEEVISEETKKSSGSATKKKSKRAYQPKLSSKKYSFKDSDEKEVLGISSGLVDNAPDVLLAGENNRSIGIIFIIFGGIIGIGYILYLNKNQIYEKLSFFKQESK